MHSPWMNGWATEQTNKKTQPSVCSVAQISEPSVWSFMHSTLIQRSRTWTPQPDSQDLEPHSIIYRLGILGKFFSLTCLSFPISKQGIIILVYRMGRSWGINSSIIYVMDLRCIESTQKVPYVSYVILFTTYGQMRLVRVVSNQTHDPVIISS